VALSLGFLAGYYAFMNAAASSKPRDFSQIWYAARALLRHVDPYTTIGPGLTFDWPNPFLYPLPAAVLALPLVPLSDAAANGVFMAFAATALAWALMEHGFAPLWGCLSASMLFACEVVQWSPLLAATVVVPVLGVALIAKPTIGAAVFLARPSWWPIAGGLVLASVTFALEPAWVAHWRGALAWNATFDPPAAPYRAPITLPGGVFILATLFRWRRPEARLLAGLACVPQTLLLYETVPLLLVPRTSRQALLLVALSWAAWWWPHAHPAGGGYAVQLRANGTMIVWLLYLPCVLMILGRPNEGAVPGWVSQRFPRIVSRA
jgi:hypothetical protein